MRAPDYTRDGIDLYLGDCLDVLPELDPVPTILTDPPYGLGFMGKEWDHGVPGIPFWQAMPLLPGGHLLAFGGTRTWHRLWSAIEDAGFELRDTLMWLHGQGFPKNHNISKALDKAAGAQREVVATIPDRWAGAGNVLCRAGQAPRPTAEVTAPATAAAVVWDGWGTALKPAWEPVVVAMAPLDGTYAANALAHGVAGLHIDAARIPTGEDCARGRAVVGDTPAAFGRGYAMGGNGSPHGRWPANLALDPVAARMLDEQSGERRPAGVHRESAGKIIDNKVFGRGFRRTDDALYDDSGGASRFFYVAKASGADIGRWPANLALDPAAARMLDEQSGELHTHPGTMRNDGQPGFMCSGRRAGDVLSHGEKGGASRFFYCAKASRSERGQGNDHPTVKPLSLMRWLVRLTDTPSHGTILDPFAGSGTTLEAAWLEGRPAIGIESDEHNFALAVARIDRALDAAATAAPLFAAAGG